MGYPWYSTVLTCTQWVFRHRYHAWWVPTMGTQVFQHPCCTLCIWQLCKFLHISIYSHICIRLVFPFIFSYFSNLLTQLTQQEEQSLSINIYGKECTVQQLKIILSLEEVYITATGQPPGSTSHRSTRTLQRKSTQLMIPLSTVGISTSSQVISICTRRPMLCLIYSRILLLSLSV